MTALKEWDFDIPQDNRFREWPLDVLRKGSYAPEKRATYPTYLTCPFCPAQAYPVEFGAELVKFKCPSNHKFLIEKEKNAESEVAAS